jgi:hydroxyacylglutathione hydrolase
MTKKLSRRDFLNLSEAVAGATILAACGTSSETAPTPGPNYRPQPIGSLVDAPPHINTPDISEFYPWCRLRTNDPLQNCKCGQTYPPTTTPPPTANPTVLSTPIMVSPHLYRVAGRVPGDNLVECCDVYLVLTPDPVLIECGSPIGWNQLMDSLDTLDISPADIKWVIGTHGHYDHIENMALFQQQYPQVKFALHAADAQFVVNDDRVFSCAATLYQGRPTGRKKVDRLLLDGYKIPVRNNIFEIIHTPGHTPGCIVIRTEIDGKAVAFCGDSVGGLYSSLNRSNVIDFENSFCRLLDYQFDLLIMGNGDARLERVQYQPILQNGLELAKDMREQKQADETYQLLCQWWNGGDCAPR